MIWLWRVIKNVATSIRSSFHGFRNNSNAASPVREDKNHQEVQQRMKHVQQKISYDEKRIQRNSPEETAKLKKELAELDKIKAAGREELAKREKTRAALEEEVAELKTQVNVKLKEASRFKQLFKAEQEKILYSKALFDYYDALFDKTLLTQFGLKENETTSKNISNQSQRRYQDVVLPPSEIKVNITPAINSLSFLPLSEEPTAMKQQLKPNDETFSRMRKASSMLNRDIIKAESEISQLKAAGDRSIEILLKYVKVLEETPSLIPKGFLNFLEASKTIIFEGLQARIRAGEPISPNGQAFLQGRTNHFYSFSVIPIQDICSTQLGLPLNFKDIPINEQPSYLTFCMLNQRRMSAETKLAQLKREVSADVFIQLAIWARKKNPLPEQNEQHIRDVLNSMILEKKNIGIAGKEFLAHQCPVVIEEENHYSPSVRC